MDGWEVCRRLREFTNIPLMFLTAKEGEENIVKGLMLGGDDYLQKPVRVAELRARVDALLRRAEAGPPAFHARSYDDGELFVDLTQPRVLLRGRPVDLMPQEYRVLAILAQNAGQVVTCTCTSATCGASWRTILLSRSASSPSEEPAICSAAQRAPLRARKPRSPPQEL